LVDATIRHMDKFLLPLEGLTLPAVWDVGVVRLHPADSARELIDDHRRGSTAVSLVHNPAADFRSTMSSAAAEVPADDIEQALDLVTTAVDVVRVYQQATTHFETTMFGIPGEIQRSVVSYAQLGEGMGVGWRARGQALGWTFGQDEHMGFRASRGFTFAANAVGIESPNEAQRRALLGIQLASQAILDHRPALRILSALMAAEAMLLERKKSPQALRLARRAVFFTCGSAEDDLCGRARPTCPALSTPVEGSNIAQLNDLRQRGDTDYRWRCSEWHRVLDWYNLRSEIVHGGSIQVSESQARSITYWLLHEVIPLALSWFAEHQTDPLGQLDDAIANLPAPPDWEELLGGERT
jgi:hypothetical protein